VNRRGRIAVADLFKATGRDHKELKMVNRHIRYLCVLATLVFAACGSDPAAPSDHVDDPDPPAGPTTGTVDVSISTTGTSSDPNGYFVALDGGAGQLIGTNEALLLEHVPVGYHSIVLTGLSSDCSISDTGPRTVNVRAGEAVSTSFEVGCATPLASGQIVFQSRPISSSGDAFRLYRMNTDGTGRTPLGTAENSNLDPSVSPDGRRIYYSTLEGIFVANADGAIPVRLTSTGASFPAVSPDGSLIAFSYVGEVLELRIMHPDGGGRRHMPLSLFPSQSSWSPDGSRLVFSGFYETLWPSGEESFLGRIFTINADGTGLQQLTTGGWDQSPSWSPDGSRIAFVRSGPSGEFHDDIFTMRPDGSDLVRLTVEEQRYFNSVAWSPDGTQLMVTSWVPDRPYSKILLMNADGSGATDLSTDPGAEDASPTFVP
jgi:Tol biopolymer transport system component